MSIVSKVRLTLLVPMSIDEYASFLKAVFIAKEKMFIHVDGKAVAFNGRMEVSAIERVDIGLTRYEVEGGK